MAMSDQDITALCIWKEARGEGPVGMQAVANVIANRVKRTGKTFTQIVLAPWQFTSMSVPNDPEFSIHPKPGDLVYAQASTLAQEAIAGTLRDVTQGATLYYAPRSIKTTAVYTLPLGTIVPFPQHWNAHAVANPIVIGRQIFWNEV
jgi:N-acetylmuramoyl-L-alanine amidase